MTHRVSSTGAGEETVRAPSWARSRNMSPRSLTPLRKAMNRPALRWAAPGSGARWRTAVAAVAAMTCVTALRGRRRRGGCGPRARRPHDVDMALPIDGDLRAILSAQVQVHAGGAEADGGAERRAVRGPREEGC